MYSLSVWWHKFLCQVYLQRLESAILWALCFQFRLQQRIQFDFQSCLNWLLCYNSATLYDSQQVRLFHASERRYFKHRIWINTNSHTLVTIQISRTLLPKRYIRFCIKIIWILSWRTWKVFSNSNNIDEMDAFEIQHVKGPNTFWHEVRNIKVSKEAAKTRTSWQNEIYAFRVT